MSDFRKDYDDEWWEQHAVVRPTNPLQAVDDFELLIGTNPPEQEIQKFLTACPWILATQFPHCHYLLPQFSFGGQFVADFVAPERSSGGTQWMLIEIERSDAKLTTTHGDYAETVRRAVRQVKDWRCWLLENQDIAKRERTHGGLGLFDMSRIVIGHVLVGRRSAMTPRFNMLRNETLSNDVIQIQTYDGIIEWARNRARFWMGL